MKNMLKDAAILFVITLIAGCLLGVVYDVTKDPIAKQEKLAWEKACQKVFPQADEFAKLEENALTDVMKEAKASVESEYSTTVEEIDEAKKGGALAGYVLIVTDHEGYGGDIKLAMGVQLDGTLNGISFLSISETAGLGMRADEVLSPQLADKKVEKFAYTKTGKTSENEIDAISGATITTNAVTNGVNGGLSFFRTALEGGTAE